jgi:pyrroline-5-carboxylate reductase
MIFGFIGAGVMARALARGVVDGGVTPARKIICSAPTQADGQPFLDQFPGARWTADNAEVLRSSDLTILAVKPQVLDEALADVKEISKGQLVLSIAAGITIAKLREWFHPTTHIVRAMPNTPMQIGLGASAYAADANVTANELAVVHRVLSSAGKAFAVEESQLDAVTALSGSGPAYVFHFTEALIQGAVALGLPEAIARELALQTVLGSAQLQSQSKLAPMELAAQVKSPRGTTLAGCAELEKDDALNQLIARCLAAAKTRAEELARGEK